ncbi:MAG: hypothetical protein OHK0029_39930 [Armatimonadaceae bacterium]
MRLLQRLIAMMTLTALTLVLSPQAIMAQDYYDIRGNWQVAQFTTRTQTLDGKQTIKGPFSFKTNTISLKIGDSAYEETNKNDKLVYGIKRSGKTYRLTREANGEKIVIQLNNIRKFDGQLYFTTTRRNEGRKERTVVNWVCDPIVPQAKLASATPVLKETTWELVEILYNNDTTAHPQAGEKMTVVFGNDGKVTGRVGTNLFNGTYTADVNGGLKISPLAVTRMADPPGSIAPTFLRELERANRYLFDTGFLILQLPIDTGIIKFKAAK